MNQRNARTISFSALILLAASLAPRPAGAGVETAAQFANEFSAICIANVDQFIKVESMAAAQSWQVLGKNMAILQAPAEPKALYKTWRKHEPDGTFIIISIAEYRKNGESSRVCAVGAMDLISDRARERLLTTQKLTEVHDSVIGDDHIHEWTMTAPSGEVTIDYMTPQGETRGPAKLYIYTKAKK